MIAPANRSDAGRNMRRLLFLLILVLTFEGLFRKMLGNEFKNATFFLKDILVFCLGIAVARAEKPAGMGFLWQAYGLAAILFVPVIIVTATHDPVLAIFGAERYLLFPIVAFAAYYAFAHCTNQDIARFVQWTALLVVPTTMVAILESRLPADHWLNLSVGGESLEAFSAAERLRVSSTFPFVAQYCMFLNVEMFVVTAGLYRFREHKLIWRMVYLCLFPLLIIGMFITGSRGAVVGNGVILVVAGLCAIVKGKGGRIIYFAVTVMCMYATFIGAKHFFPSAFEAYSERENGKLVGVSSEVQSRAFGALFGWVKGSEAAPPNAFGYGIGVMSNGSQNLSKYASAWRVDFWTETDIATTLFEGGFYLVFVWYGLRLFVLCALFTRFLQNVTHDLILPASFCLGYVVMEGITGTLGIQAPEAIWWWFAVGISSALSSKVHNMAVDAPDASEESLALVHKIPGRSPYAERLHRDLIDGR